MREFCDLETERNPYDHLQLLRFKKRVGSRRLQRIMNKLVKKLLKCRVIDGEAVVVSSPEVTQPVAVRYAWADNPEATLRNGAGLPASPFRTDDWPMLTAPRPPSGAR